MRPALTAPPVVLIEPARRSAAALARELYAYRELLYFLAWRDFKVRYKQTVLGAAWAVIQPLLTMVVFAVFFGYFGRLPSDGLPYPLFAYSALLPWSLFATTLTEASQSIVTNRGLITKVYFPRIIVPLAPLFVALVDLAIAGAVLVLLLLGYGMAPAPTIVLVPAFVALAAVTALAAGTWLAALNVRYRDVRYAIPFLVQLWFFATPVAYPSSLLPEPWRTLYGVNPMVGAVEGFRWAVMAGTPPGRGLLLSVVAALALLAGGLWYFHRTEESFADLA